MEFWYKVLTETHGVCPVTGEIAFRWDGWDGQWQKEEGTITKAI